MGVMLYRVLFISVAATSITPEARLEAVGWQLARGGLEAGLR